MQRNAVNGREATRGFACVGLDNPKNPLNVGSILRAAGCFGVRMVVVAGPRPARYYTRIPTDTLRAWRHLPLVLVDELRKIVPHDCVPVAVDLVPGARPLPDYVHPKRAFYVFGAEDATLGPRVLEWCRDVIYVPTRYCLNLAACVNVILYDRLAKMEEKTVFTPFGEAR